MPPNISFRHVILSQLYESPMHGYKLGQDATSYSWICPLRRTSLYPVLHELEADGMIVHRSEIHDGRARKVYSLTDRGRVELESWLAVAPEQDVEFSDSVAFKIAAYRDGLADGSTAWMTSTIEKLDSKIDECQKQLEEEVDGDGYAAMAVEYGIEMLRLRKRLLEKVLDRTPPRVVIVAKSAAG